MPVQRQPFYFNTVRSQHRQKVEKQTIGNERQCGFKTNGPDQWLFPFPASSPPWISSSVTARRANSSSSHTKPPLSIAASHYLGEEGQGKRSIGWREKRGRRAYAFLRWLWSWNHTLQESKHWWWQERGRMEGRGLIQEKKHQVKLKQWYFQFISKICYDRKAWWQEMGKMLKKIPAKMRHRNRGCVSTQSDILSTNPLKKYISSNSSMDPTGKQTKSFSIVAYHSGHVLILNKHWSKTMVWKINSHELSHTSVKKVEVTHNKTNSPPVN